MGSNSPRPGNTPPPKPWERAGSSSGPAPFRPPSSGSTSNVVEASGTAKPGEIVRNTQRPPPANTNAIGRPLPSRPWERNFGNSPGGYGSTMYGSYGGFGGSLGGGMYGNSMYGGGGYGGPFGGSGTYGGSMNNNSFGGPGSMNNNSFGGPMGGYGMGAGGPFGNQDPNDPFGAPPSPPGFWMSFLRVMHGVVNFFGRLSILIDQNTHAFHMFMSALLQLFDRSGLLYGELARFVLRLLGIRTKPRKRQQGPDELPGPSGQGQHCIEGPKAPTALFDSAWGDGGAKGSC